MMRRSSFLHVSAGAMAVAALPKLSQRVLANDTVDYALTASPLRFSPVAGVDFPGLAYGGAIPGPTLRVMHGQRVRVRYVNRTDTPTTVHWHGQIIPNDMDGAAGLTQPPVLPGQEFLYHFAPNPPGTRWYHDHGMHLGMTRGLFGMFIIDDPHEGPADAEFALVFHDVPRLTSVDAAMNGVSTAPMTDPIGSPELLQMKPNDKMGDEVAYVAHCINGASYPNTAKLAVKVGQRVRLRILNANPTQTRYVRLAGHRLTVTHADGNLLEQPVEVDALRIGVAERYDAWFAVTKPGAWLLQGLSSDPLGYQQAAIVYTEGMENASPLSSPQSLDGVDILSYQKLGGVTASRPRFPPNALVHTFTLGGGKYASDKWTIDGKAYPHTPKVSVRRGDDVVIHFKNTTDMDHPMHLHGHTFGVMEVDGISLARPLLKDTSLVRANDGTMTWHFKADSPPGRWLLHCHNDIHMMDGMMTEIDYL